MWHISVLDFGEHLEKKKHDGIYLNSGDNDTKLLRVDIL